MSQGLWGSSGVQGSIPGDMGTAGVGGPVPRAVGSGEGGLRGPIPLCGAQWGRGRVCVCGGGRGGPRGVTLTSFACGTLLGTRGGGGASPKCPPALGVRGPQQRGGPWGTMGDSGASGV